MAKVKDLLREALDCDAVPDPVATEHLRARGHQPGLVNVELWWVQEKVALISKLKSSDRF